MCSSHFFNIIRILEDSFANDIFNAAFNNDYKFYKSSKDHGVGDYICFASNPQCALEASKHWESKCIEKFPWIKDYIKVTSVPHGFSISLCRKLSFFSGLQEVYKYGKKYGYNSLYRGKGYTMSVIKTKSSGCLTALRLDIVFEVTANILKACGGTPYHEADCNNLIEIYVTNKNIPTNDSVAILVGPVNLQTSDSKSIVDSVLYKRYRMNEITTMCEHKGDVSDSIENKSKLLKTIIHFDLLQSNIWRSVTIHLLDKNSGESTSCKGSLFVMYNYARLHTLCEQFDDKVSSGIYPPLPPLEEIDFAILDKDEEWKIMFHGILCWPSILRKSIIDLETEAEHGYASTLPPDDLRVIKRPKTKTKSQGSRTTHNELEKNRRAHLRNCLEKLKEMVPLGHDTSRHTTLGLLTKAKRFIKSLEQQERRAAVQKEHLQREHRFLRRRLDSLHHGASKRRSVSESSVSTVSSTHSTRTASSFSFSSPSSISESDEVDVIGYTSNQSDSDDHGSVQSMSSDSGVAMSTSRLSLAEVHRSI